MRKILLLALIVIGLSGCATTPASYGNFAPSSVQANDKKVADDAVKLLVTLYSPASTRFDLQHATPDFFGTYLLETMRGKGYAIMEFKPTSKTASSSNVDESKTAPLATTGLPFSYIVDRTKGTDFYRLTLVINGQQTLDRIYQVADDGVIYPAGYWARKE